jgi:ubiquinone/menaquinone biosynthesis C-methylase UbiE
LKENQYIQYGSGMSAPKGWRNFDASATLRFERLPLIGRLSTKNNHRFPKNVEYGDIVKGLPVADSSCKAIYCSHVLEHLSLEDFRVAIRNTYIILKKDGIFRLVLPDLEYAIKNYINDSSPNAALNFMKETSLGKKKRNRGLTAFILEWFGNSQHFWMWDYRSLEDELKDAGFIEIRRAKFADGSDPMFKEVEENGRWKNCLGIECKK